MSLAGRFEGSVEPIEGLDLEVEGLAEWVLEVPFSGWPQQRFGELRPAMISDPEWRGFHGRVRKTVERVLGKFPGGKADTLLLSVVMPGHEIAPHVDEQPPHWWTRVHVPLVAGPGSEFLVENVAFHLSPGHAYRVNTLRQHSVVNRGSTPRVHFMFDVKGPR